MSSQQKMFVRQSMGLRSLVQYKHAEWMVRWASLDDLDDRTWNHRLNLDGKHPERCLRQV
jgi:hypothetical protein